jgi:ElaA protein
MNLHVARTAGLDPATLYLLLRLRVAVFVVEQQCPYPELDGRDLEPGTRHLWFTEGDDAGQSTVEAGQPVAYLRLLEDPDDVARIGRVCTAVDARGKGLSGRLVEVALELLGDRDCLLDAQSHLARFYARYGFEPTGPEFIEDGIPHIPMRRSQS